MIKPEQVPEASWRIACDVLGDLNVYSAEMKAAIAAALAAWPGLMAERRARCDAFVLPFNLDPDLPQKRETPIQHHDRRYNVAERLFGDD